MLSFFRKAAAARPAPLRSAEQLLAALDGAPTVLLITDPAGEIVYRNAAADDLARRTAATYGDEVLILLRDRLRQSARDNRSFPSTEQITVGTDADAVHVSSTATRIPGGFAVTWADITDEVNRARISGELVQEMSDASISLTQLSESLTGNAGETSQQTHALSSGSAEMTHSIGEITERMSTATSSTQHAVGSARTADATRQITAMIDTIQAESVQATEAIEGIAGLIEQVADQQSLIADAVEQQSATTGQMSEWIGSVATSVSTSATAAETVRTAATSIHDQADRLRRLVTT